MKSSHVSIQKYTAQLYSKMWFLGMLEKAVLFSEYNNVNDTGVPGIYFKKL
jgi:hypothetical protein